MFYNIHTHSVNNNENIRAIVNIENTIDISLYNNQLYSYGIHPWKVSETDNLFDNKIKELNYLCSNNMLTAIGECGVDMLYPDVEKQKQVFVSQIEISEYYKLPVIIHSVKANHIILELRKTTKSTQPWIIHGFNGSVQLAKQFADKNIYVSFGEAILKNPDKYKSIINAIDLNYMFLENDISKKSIIDIYNQAADLLGINIVDLQKKIQNNIDKITSIREFIKKPSLF